MTHEGRFNNSVSFLFLSFQVLSTSVSNAFKFIKKDEFSETEKFCHMFDKFFDCLNTRQVGEGKQKCKPDL